MHAAGALGGAELDLLDQEQKIDTEFLRSFDLASGGWTSQALSRASQLRAV